jgi:hypothetical protein
MAFRRGLLQYLDYGVGASTTATVGRTMSGSWDIDDGSDEDLTITGQSVAREGMVQATGNATLLVTNSAKTLIATAKRASVTSAMSALTFEGGVTGFAAYRMTGCKITSLALSCRRDQHLQAAISWMALTPSQIAVPTWKALDSGGPFKWFQGVCTLNGSAYQLQDFTVTLTNTISPESSLDQGSAGSLRLPEELVELVEKVTVAMTVAQPLTSTVLDDVYADVASYSQAASLVFTNAASQTATITLSNLKLKSWSDPFEAAGVIYMGLQLEGLTNSNCYSFS